MGDGYSFIYELCFEAAAIRAGAAVDCGRDDAGNIADLRNGLKRLRSKLTKGVYDQVDKLLTDSAMKAAISSANASKGIDAAASLLKSTDVNCTIGGEMREQPGREFAWIVDRIHEAAKQSDSRKVLCDIATELCNRSVPSGKESPARDTLYSRIDSEIAKGKLDSKFARKQRRRLANNGNKNAAI